MNTPVCDFVRDYARREPTRLHMPGHKGKALLGPEPLDITEIPGADVLYQPTGILRESQDNASMLFGSAKTVYSTEGSSLCIRAMLYLVRMFARLSGREPRIAAGRNAHRVFLEAAALLDLTPHWLGAGQGLLSCEIRPEELQALFTDADTAPAAVYVTSPDYLGNCVDLAVLAEICHKNGALLLVDNAHGAYLKFLPRSRHPLDLGADLCCDSAHKTLPVLTGGAYLHFSKDCPASLLPLAERAMALFASTSPSYLILQSLDGANRLLAETYPQALNKTAELVEKLRISLSRDGWDQVGQEPLKLTLRPKSRGYTGSALAEQLETCGIFSEFSDPDNIVFMFTPETPESAFSALRTALERFSPRDPILTRPPVLQVPAPCMTPREVLFCPFENVSVSDSLGRVLASPSVSCPPAVPILVCGERITEGALRCFDYYGIQRCDVVLE